MIRRRGKGKESCSCGKAFWKFEKTYVSWRSLSPKLHKIGTAISWIKEHVFSEMKKVKVQGAIGSGLINSLCSTQQIQITYFAINN